MHVRIVGYIFTSFALSTADIVAIGNTSCGRRRLVIAIQLFTILHTLSGRRRSLLTAMQFFGIEYTSRRSRRLVIAIQLFTILHTLTRRRRLPTLQFTIPDVVAIRLIVHFVFEGMRIGEAAHPGPRLRRRGPRSLYSRTVRRNHEGPANEIPESKIEGCETGLKMLHINLRGYLSHIAETTALLRGM